MNDLQVFHYCGNTVRTVERNGDPWFVLKDVCVVLGIGNSRMVSDRLDDDEKGVSQIDTPGGVQNMSIISESGLYNVILRSDKPEAKPFRKWVTAEVIPTIRKTGGYNPRPLSGAEQLLAQAQYLVEQERRLKAVEEKQERFDNAVAVMAAPLMESGSWQEKAQKAINTAVERCGLNHQMFRSELYEEVERRAHVDLGSRQTRMRKRMMANGATATECKAITKLHVIARDDKLRVIFETVLRQKVLRLDLCGMIDEAKGGM